MTWLHTMSQEQLAILQYDYDYDYDYNSTLSRCLYCLNASIILGRPLVSNVCCCSVYYIARGKHLITYSMTTNSML